MSEDFYLRLLVKYCKNCRFWTSWGPTIIFFRKKSSFQNDLSLDHKDRSFIHSHLVWQTLSRFTFKLSHFQGVKRENSGNYTCRVANTEGEGVSNVVTLAVQCEFTLFLVWMHCKIHCEIQNNLDWPPRPTPIFGLSPMVSFMTNIASSLHFDPNNLQYHQYHNCNHHDHHHHCNRHHYHFQLRLFVRPLMRRFTELRGRRPLLSNAGKM